MFSLIVTLAVILLIIILLLDSVPDCLEPISNSPKCSGSWQSDYLLQLQLHSFPVNVHVSTIGNKYGSGNCLV